MLKKFLISLLAVGTVSAFACWFTESNFNATYIASVNGAAVHYAPVSTISQAVYQNGQQVDLPITVQIKVSDRFADQSGESGTRPVTSAILQYKIVRQNGTSTSFITVKTLNNPNWHMNFSSPVNLFGRSGIINIPNGQISAGDDIIIRVWMSDGTYYTGDLDADISVNQVPDTQSSALGNVSIGEDGWKAPHVFRVKFSGKRRTII